MLRAWIDFDGSLYECCVLFVENFKGFVGFVSILSLRSLKRDTLTKKGDINLLVNV